jgi:hypothetical protein
MLNRLSQPLKLGDRAHRAHRADVPRRSLLTAAILLVCAAHAPQVHADEHAELAQLRATTTNLIDTLVESGLLTREKADALLKKAQQPRAPVATTVPTEPAVADRAEKKNVIRVPYVPETVKAEMREEIKRDVLAQARTERWGEPGALPSWMRRLTVDGDVRVRLQSEDWDKNNFAQTVYDSYAQQTASPSWAPDLTNTTNDRTRLTLRARLGVTSDLAYGFKAGMRLSTGSAGPVSASQTLGGGDGHDSKYSLFVDRAWLQWNAFDPDFTLSAGRIANPFFGGDLIWPDDVNFDGVASSYRHKFDEFSRLFANAGVFPLQEFQTAAKDKWLYGMQLGGDFKTGDDTLFSVGLGYYDFHDIEGEFDARYEDDAVNLPGSGHLSSAYPKSVRSKGNTLIRINQDRRSLGGAIATPVWGLASPFRPVTLSLGYAYAGWDTLNLKGSVDIIKNTGFDLADLRRRANQPTLDVAEKTLGFQARLHIGSPRQELRGDWSTFLTWRRFERDAWVDAFTDTTWHLGGTNYSGWSLGGQYFVGPRTSAGLRLTSTRNLKDGRVVPVNTQLGVVPGPNTSSAELKVDVIQLELNARF